MGLFSIFQNKNEVKTSVPEIKTDSYSEVIGTIHNEFNTAADKLVEEANKVIQEATSKDTAKVTRLEKLGFVQSNQVKELKPLIIKIAEDAKILKLVTYYQQNYPNNKFITESQVLDICYKYGLVCGNVSRYKGFVPDKNLKQIEAFKLKEQDDISPKLGEVYIILNDWSLLNVKDLITEQKKVLNHKIEYVKGADYCYSGNRSINGLSNIEGWGKTFQYRLDNMNDPDIVKAIKRNTGSLQVCAPIKDMDITGTTLEDGYKLKKEYKDIPDPIILQPVKGGYLILTMWADESFDPAKEESLVNYQEN